MRNIYVYQWRSKGERGGRSALGSKINPLESMIISDIMLKSKNKAANSGCNNTKIFEAEVSEKMLIPNKKGRQKIWGK